LFVKCQEERSKLQVQHLINVCPPYVDTLTGGTSSWPQPTDRASKCSPVPFGPFHYTDIGQKNLHSVRR